MAIINVNKKKLSDVVTLDEVVTQFSNPNIKENEGIVGIYACFNFIKSITTSSIVFPKLSILSLACNNIKEIPHLECCPNLLELNLNNNSIQKLTNLNLVPRLRYLTISCNFISALENISELNCLEKLILSCNHIHTIDYSTLPVSLHSLTQLGLLDNRLVSVNEIEPLLDSAHNLRKLSIGMNPFTDSNMLSTSYLITDLRIPRRDIFDPTSVKEIAVSENDRALHIRQFILNKCNKLEFLDLYPI